MVGVIIGRLGLACKPYWARLLLGVAAGLMIIIPLGLTLRHHQLYTISTASRQLLTKSSVDVSKLKVTDKAISYNEADQKPTQSKSLTIAGPTDATGKTGYQASINKDFNRGLKFGDSSSELGFTMTPLFNASSAQYQNGQVMFPVSGSTRIYQTFKKNGIKEDIVLTKAPSKTASWKWRLALGEKLAARLMPDGSVGIFAANPDLYGNIQISDAKSQALVDKARTGDKSYQIFAIPAPFIKNAKGQTIKDDVSFKLAGDTLTLEARNLNNKNYPISIDPSVVITTTADFATGSDDGMVDYSIANQIGRSSIGLGTVGVTSSQAGAFTGGRYGHTSVAYNGFLYIIGGFVAGGAQNDIQFASMGSGGALSCPVGYTPCASGTVFATNPTGLTTARYYHTSVAYNGYLYVVGGIPGAAQTGAEHCPINSNGSVGTCIQQTTALPIAREQMASVVYNGYLYVTGGTDGTTIFNSIRYAAINADGSLACPASLTCTGSSVFGLNGATIVTGRYSHTSVTSNGYLYIIGGYDSTSTPLNDIQHCPINNDGSIGTCVQQAAAFTTARYGHTSVAYNGYLYVIGGYNGTSQNDIQSCPINADGTVRACVVQAAAFTTARYEHTSVVYNGYIYVVGGRIIGTSYNDIQHLLISSGTPAALGAVGSTTQQTSAFTTTRYSHTSVVYNGYLYIIGGYGNGTAQNDIQHCPLNADGSVGICVQQTNAFTTARYKHTSVVYNGYVYIIGGYDGTSGLNDIQHCPLNADGSVGTCVVQTAAFTTIRHSHTSVVYNGYLYIIGGTNGTAQNDIQHCPLNADGSVGTCVVQAAAFTTARYNHTSVVSGGYLYITGGSNATTAQNDIQHCPLNVDGSVGSCIQQVAAFSPALYSHTSVVYNGNLYIIGGYSGSLAYNDIQHCPLNADGSVGTCVVQAGAFTTARFNHTSVVYNGNLYIIGGTNPPTNLNDIQHFTIAAFPQVAHYERVVDLGKTYDSVDSIQYNGMAPCGVKLQYAVAGSNGIFSASTTVYEDSMPGRTYALSNVTLIRYVRLTLSINDQSCGGTGIITDITVNGTLLPPAAPTLSAPASGAISVSPTPTFALKTTDALDVYAQYKILVYQSDCSTLVRTIDQTISQTGWSGQDAQTSTAYVVANILSGSTLASHTYQAAALSFGTTYCWKAAAIDPGGSNTFGAYSATQLFTTNKPPLAPTLTLPATAQTGVSTTPELRLFTTDPDNDYLKYKIDVCSTSNCSSIVRTIDETSSQIGWGSQSQQSATAYSSGQIAIHTYQAPALGANTQYWWRAYAIDPAGTNTFSVASTIGTFNTTLPTQSNINISGSTTIYGGVTLGQ